MSDAFDEDTTEPISVSFTTDLDKPEYEDVALPEMSGFLEDLGVSADEMEATMRFFELRVVGVEPQLAALEVGWSLRKLRTKERDPYFAEVLAEITASQNESVEAVVLRKARGGNADMIKMWLYNRAPERWKDVRRIVDERHDDPVEHVAASVTAGILDAVRLLGVRDMQAALAPGAGAIEATVSGDADRDETG
jgi:hypothetical protein